jgi:hypothetical protein
MTTIKALRELTPAGRMIRVALTRPEPDGTVGATVLESAAASHPSPRALAAASAHWQKKPPLATYSKSSNEFIGKMVRQARRRRALSVTPTLNSLGETQ